MEAFWNTIKKEAGIGGAKKRKRKQLIKKEASSGSVKKRKFILPDPTEIVGQPRMIPPPVDLEALPPSIDSGVRMFTDIMPSRTRETQNVKFTVNISYRSHVVKPKRRNPTENHS